MILFTKKSNFAVGKLVAENIANANSLAYALVKNFFAVVKFTTAKGQLNSE